MSCIYHCLHPKKRFSFTNTTRISNKNRQNLQGVFIFSLAMTVRTVVLLHFLLYILCIDWRNSLHRFEGALHKYSSLLSFIAHGIVLLAISKLRKGLGTNVEILM
jgi:hypothetical protein